MNIDLLIKRRSIVLLFLLFTAACNINDIHTGEVNRWKDSASRVTIIRDKWGVPHVFGKTDADAVFGLIYAQCEDDFNRVEVNYINAMGRMAEVEGEEFFYNDLRMKLFIDTIDVKEEYKNSPVWLKKLMNAFADGLNYFLYTHPEVHPKLIKRFEPWMALTFTEGSIGGDIETISVSELKSFYGNLPVEMTCDTPISSGEEPGGSNGFAIAPSISASGNALLLINPHTSLFFRSEVHMVSENGLNTYGAVTWGQFFVYQGFNEKCGWMHTSSKADVIDYYLETVVEKNGKYFYKYGDELRPFVEKIITIPFAEGNGLAEKQVKVYYSHHGPVVSRQSDGWVTVSLMKEHIKALTQSYLRTKADGYRNFKKIMDLRTNSSNNTVYADAEGNIAYFHGNFMPVRDEKFDWSGTVDGSNPATDWKGIHNLDDMILILNPSNGWIQNCNSTPFTACGENSPRREDYPSYMAPDNENPRGIHAVRVLEGHTGFTPDKLLEAAYDSYLPAFETIIPSLISAYDQISKKNSSVRNYLAPQIGLLRDWDFRYSENSVQTTLAVYWGQAMISELRSAIIAPGKSIFDYIAEEGAPVQLIDGLYNAVNELINDFGTWEVPWGDINRYQRLTGDIVQVFNDDKPSLPVPFTSSQWGSLASFAARKYPGTRKMYGTSGNSFVSVVEFGERIKAKSVLAGGISSDPGSKHFDDQALMYTKGEFKDVLFYRDQIEENSERKYFPGQ